MLSAAFDVTFRVRAETAPGQVVCVVGDCPQLGNWRPEHAKILKLERLRDQAIWSRSIRIPSRDVQYRYFIGYMRDADHEGDARDVMVRQWETNIRPRVFSLKACMDPEDENADAVFGHYNGEKNVDKGWLTGQTEIQMRLHSNPIRMWKHKHRQQSYRIRCTAIDLRYRDVTMEHEDDDSSHDLTVATGPNKVNISVLNGRDYLPQEQAQFGATYEEDDYMIFRAQTFEQEYMGFQFDFYVNSGHQPEDPPKHVGVAFILPVNLQGTDGVKNIPINGLKHRPIGQFAVDYLIIKPLKMNQCDMSVSYARHWNRKRGPVDVGHRGMGSSYTSQCEGLRENTIASLSEAGSHGADFVEFDVQLSRDDEVVIYHDLCACLSMKKKGSLELEYFEVPIQDLTFQQLQMLKLDHVSEKTKGGSPKMQSDVLDPEDRQPFPLLRQALESVDPSVGFNIEIKYCMRLKTGELEEGLGHYMERNRYLDLILTDVLKYSGKRRIIFSSFDPDICSMLRLKQNRYPIGFLTQGSTTRYAPYKDIRTQTTPLSASFARCESLLALNGHAEDLLRDMDLIQQARDMGLVVLCWGDDANNKATIKRLKEAGVDGVIYDRIHELKEKVFKMEDEDKVHLLQDLGMLDPHRVSNGLLTGSPENTKSSVPVPDTSGSTSPGTSGTTPPEKSFFSMVINGDPLQGKSNGTSK